MVAYGGRPGVSPVTAALVADGTLDLTRPLLDLGCGDGAEAVALARWGARRVVGVDWDARAIATARRRAAGARVARRVEFVVGDARDLAETLGARRFDAALDTLLSNNLKREEDVDAYTREVAAVLSPGGVFVLQWRTTKRAHGAGPRDLARDLPRNFRRYFRTPGVFPTHLPEAPTRADGAGHAVVAVCVARRK